MAFKIGEEISSDKFGDVPFGGSDLSSGEYDYGGKRYKVEDTGRGTRIIRETSYGQGAGNGGLNQYISGLAESYQKLNQPALDTLKQTQSTIAPRYDERKRAIEAEIDPTKSRYEQLLQGIVRNQKTAEERQALYTGNELGRRGISNTSGVYERTMAQSLNPITQSYTGNIEELGYQREKSLRELQNMIGALPGQQSQEEGAIAQIMAQIQAGVAPGAISTALALYQSDQQAQAQNNQLALSRLIAERDQAEREWERPYLERTYEHNLSTPSSSSGSGLTIQDLINPTADLQHIFGNAGLNYSPAPNTNAYNNAWQQYFSGLPGYSGY